MRSTHSDRIERWLGTRQCEEFSSAMKGWYGTPIPVAGVPGNVWIDKQGDFIGPIDGGQEAPLHEYLWDRIKRSPGRKQHGGFADLTALQNSLHYDLAMSKTWGATASSSWVSYWPWGPLPAIGAIGAAAPGGTVPTRDSVGALWFKNADTGKTLHVVGGNFLTTVQIGTLLLYDRIFAVATTMNSTDVEAVTGVPNRYQNTTGGAIDSAENNFLVPEVITTLPSIAHQWDICTYTDQNGNAGAELPVVTGISLAQVGRLDKAANQWFCPLAAGDTGVLALTQMQCTALLTSGTLNFMMGHPLAFFPMTIEGYAHLMVGINSAFNFSRIFDNACLAFLSLSQTATATTTTGNVQIAEG